MEEKYFDYEKYMHKRLKEIDDLDERKYAKELLLDSLKGIFEWSETRYRDLERRIQGELDVPWMHFNVHMTVIQKEDYDPINSFWHPVCEEDMEWEKEALPETIYLAADEKLRRKFQGGIIEGVTEETGKKVCFRIIRSVRYEEQMKKLYRLFSNNAIPWQTVHMGHLERFFDLVPEGGEAPENENIRILWGEWEEWVRPGMIPLWNIQRMAVQAQEFRHPCLDEVVYEQIYYLGNGISNEEDGYLVETKEDILSVRYEKNRAIVRTNREDMGNVFLYRLCQGDRGNSYGYQYPVLSNKKKENFAARYLYRAGNFIQTPAELRRKVEELSGSYGIHFSGYEIRGGNSRPYLCKDADILEGDMNGYGGIQVFSRDERNILIFHFLRKEEAGEGYLYETQIRYILSQLQIEFMEYRCVGMIGREEGGVLL